MNELVTTKSPDNVCHLENIYLTFHIEKEREKEKERERDRNREKGRERERRKRGTQKNGIKFHILETLQKCLPIFFFFFEKF